MTTQATNIAEMKTYGASMSDGDSLDILGYYAAGDGGGGKFYWDATSTDTDNGGTIIQATGVTTGRWLRVFTGAANVKWFGAKGGNVSTEDDLAAIQAAVDLDVGVYLPVGEYYISATLNLTSSAGFTGQSNNLASSGYSKPHLGVKIINNTAGDCAYFDWSYDGSITNVHFSSTYGHALVFAGVRCRYTDVSLYAAAADKSCLKLVDGGQAHSNVFDGGQWLVDPNITRTAPVVDITSASTYFNGNVFKNMWIHSHKSTTIQAIKLELTVTGSYLYNNMFDNVIFEVCEGGAFSLAGTAHTVINNCAMWDTTTYNNDIILVRPLGTGPGESPAYQTRELRILGFERAGSVLASGKHDIKLGYARNTLITNFHHAGSAGPSSINYGNTVTTLQGEAPANESGLINVTKLTSSITANNYTLIKAGGPIISAGTGSPEGVHAYPQGSLYMRTDGINATTMYVKMSADSSSTSWVAHTP